jgi:hypothetical protein
MQTPKRVFTEQRFLGIDTRQLVNMIFIPSLACVPQILRAWYLEGFSSKPQLHSTPLHLTNRYNLRTSVSRAFSKQPG